MGKSIFIIILLIAALVVASKIQSFVKNNSPVPIPAETSSDEISTTTDLVNPVIYKATSTEYIDRP